MLTGTEDDIEDAKEVLRRTDAKPIVAVGKTDILELAALIGRCTVYITSDSAPMHVAASMGVPLVALFGATDPQRHAPKVAYCRIMKSDVKCSPCYKPTCPRGNQCMKKIAVEDVLGAVSEFIDVKKTRTEMAHAVQ
jgi:ADP-heptose:LPS heptosyltransferase